MISETRTRVCPSFLAISTIVCGVNPDLTQLNLLLGLTDCIPSWRMHDGVWYSNLRVCADGPAEREYRPQQRLASHYSVIKHASRIHVVEKQVTRNDGRVIIEIIEFLRPVIAGAARPPARQPSKTRVGRRRMALDVPAHKLTYEVLHACNFVESTSAAIPREGYTTFFLAFKRR